MVGGCIASWASLLYHVLLYCCQWVGRSIRCYYAFLSCVHGFVFFCFFFSLFLPLHRPRSGIVQRSSSMYQFRFFQQMYIVCSEAPMGASLVKTLTIMMEITSLRPQKGAIKEWRNIAALVGVSPPSVHRHALEICRNVASEQTLLQSIIMLSPKNKMCTPINVSGGSRSLQTWVSTIQSVVPTADVFEFSIEIRCMSRYHTLRQQHCKLPRQHTVAKTSTHRETKRDSHDSGRVYTSAGANTERRRQPAALMFVGLLAEALAV